MADVAHYPNEDCTCESNSDERCEYRMLADAVIAKLDPHDGDEAEVSLCIDAVSNVVARVADLEALVHEMLATFTKTSDGHRARVGQVQIARWQKRMEATHG